MKKVLLTFALVFIGYTSYSQAYTNSSYNHEIKFNIGHFLATTTFESSYEYYINEDTSLGGTIYFNGDATDYNGNFGIGPNLRTYFGYQPKSGLFAEVFVLYYTGEDKDLSKNTQGLKYDYSTTALGLGGGGKWSTMNQKFTLEINGGIGRNINPEDFQSSFMFKAGLSIGMRF